MQTLLAEVPFRDIWYLEALTNPEWFEFRNGVLHRTFFHPQFLETQEDWGAIG